jgi:NAD(P)-dependent dehydrogenase (short-subunit alcohol dehydrogenase family)
VADVQGQQPEQQQPGPGTTAQMEPKPQDEMTDYVGRGLLDGKRALITGGDSGIGRAVTIAFAKEGANVAIAYLCEHEDAKHTAKLVAAAGRRAVLLPGELADEQHATQIVQRTVEELGGLDILVNHVGTQTPAESLEEISSAQFDYTFKVNIYSHFWTTKAALRHLPDGASIINTASINGLRGNKMLLDYSATKGAVLAFTYALAQNLVERRIRVNAVAPGPVWAPLVPATFPPEKTSSFGQDVPMGRAAHPDEIAPSYVFFAAERLSSYYTGEVLAPIGGETLPG